ncbi:MAG: transposase [Desulfovibrio sp.]|uniref:transposase n=1 Tax=Desulfovibrio sp. 7SRBS1 TaxID=3378064 RepID=UPI003B42475B
MKRAYISVELAQILQVAERSVQRRAKREGWTSRPRIGRGGGNEWLTDGLPAEVRRKIQAHELQASDEFLPTRHIDSDEISKLTSRWDSAPEWSQERAKARLAVVEAADRFIASCPGKKTAAEVKFCRLYSSDPAQVGVSAEVAAHVKKISAPSLRRFRSLYQKQGLAGLLSGHGANKGNRLAVTPEVRVFVLANLQERPHMTVAMLKNTADGIFGDTAPSEATIRRFVEDFKADNPQLYALLENPKNWKNQYQAAFGDACDAEYFGHVWEMDSTPADVMTADGKRCCIIGCIDVYSRRLVLLCAETSKAVSVAACMRKAMLLWGLPATIRMDNGADYASKHVTAILGAFGITRDNTRLYHGEDKPFIERALGTYTHGLHELLPHYTGHDVRQRAALREQATWAKRVMDRTAGTVEIPLTMEQLQEATNKWLPYYETTERPELGGLHPLARAHSSPRQPTRLVDERILDILLAPIGQRTVGKKGIAYQNRRFSADELVPLVGNVVELREDAENAGRIYVFQRTGRRVKFICTATDAAWDGVRVSSYNAARKRHERNLRDQVKSLKVLSETIDDPSKIIFETGEARVETFQAERGNVRPFQAQADTPEIRAAAQAFAESEPELGLAQQYGHEAEPEPTEPELPDGVVKLPVPTERPAPEPMPMFNTPIEAFDWLCTKEERDGVLSPDHYEWKKTLEKSDSVRDILKLRADTAALSNVERRF